MLKILGQSLSYRVRDGPCQVVSHPPGEKSGLPGRGGHSVAHEIINQRIGGVWLVPRLKKRGRQKKTQRWSKIKRGEPRTNPTLRTCSVWPVCGAARMGSLSAAIQKEVRLGTCVAKFLTSSRPSSSRVSTIDTTPCIA